MLRSLLKSKIHRATVTLANVDYEGSISIDQDLMERVDLWPGELVHVWDVDNGQRFETYVITAPRASGEVGINGAAARRVEVGHRLIIAAFGISADPIEPRMVLVDAANTFVRTLP